MGGRFLELKSALIREGMKMQMKVQRIGIILGLLVAIALVSSMFAAPAGADPVKGTLFYTTFALGVNVHKVDFDYNGTTFTLSNNTDIASLSGADGLLFAPNGNLLVAGQGNSLIEITTGGTLVTTVAPGGGSFHLALSSDSPNATVYNLDNGGCGSNCISAVTLSGGGLSANGNLYTVSGALGISLDVRGVILNTKNNTWYYGTAPDGGTGEFGTVTFNDITHTATLTRLKTGLYAHGLSFDPFSGNVIVNSATTLQQLDAAGNVLSTLTIPDEQFDQASVDGKGHLFAASNFGDLLFVDYDATGLIGAGANFKTTKFLADNLDDIAPLVGPGAPPASVPEPSSVLLLGTGIGCIIGWGYRRRVGSITL